MPSAQLFFSGIEYSFNTYRMIFNKVDYARLRLADGSLAEIDDEKLYCVVVGMYYFCKNAIRSSKEPLAVSGPSPLQTG